MELNLADATIDNLEIVGSNYGIKWTAIGGMTSYLNSSLIRGSQGCMELIDHTDLVSSSVHFECEGANPSTSSSFVNFTDSSFSTVLGMSDTFSTLGNSHIRWISSSQIATPNFTGSDNIVDLMWFVEANVVNQNLRNIPFSDVNFSFDQLEVEFTHTLPYSGREVVGPFVGQRWTPVQGWSQNTTMSPGCDYDGVHNESVPIQLTSDSVVTLSLIHISEPTRR